MRNRAPRAPRGFHLRRGCVAFVLALGGAVALGACGPSKAAQCSELITLVNDATKRLEEAPTKPDADRAARVTNLRGMAAGMSKVADDLDKTKTTIPELKDFSTRYQKLAREFARIGIEMADSVDASDLEKQNLAREQLDKTAETEGPLVATINEFCKGS